jgi:hypothetical protein
MALAGAPTDALPASPAVPAAVASTAAASVVPFGPGSAPGDGSGLDLGLLVAALAGGGLGGLALLRLAAARRRAT